MKYLGNKKSASLIELNELLNRAFALWISHTGPHTLWASCLTCTYMRKMGPAYCERYKVVPPVDVITGVEDCPGYSNMNEIPFD